MFFKYLTSQQVVFMVLIKSMCFECHTNVNIRHTYSSAFSRLLMEPTISKHSTPFSINRMVL